MKQISLILILALLVTLAACGKQAPALPTEQETVASEPQTLPEAETFSVEPQNLKGYALTPDGDSVPVQLTMQVEDVGNTQPLIFEGYGQVLKFAIQ